MSHYITRYCSTHGLWDDDVDNPANCPRCRPCSMCGGTGTQPEPTAPVVPDAERATGFSVEDREWMERAVALVDARRPQVHEATCDLMAGSLAASTRGATPMTCTCGEEAARRESGDVSIALRRILAARRPAAPEGE